MNDLPLYIETNKKLIDIFIQDYFKKKNYGKKFPHNNFSLQEAMLYTVNTPGKRIRPIMVMITADSLGFSDTKKLLPFASAIELIHSYSLIHDDLPSMDNDSLRRGKPTNHIVFGEASAILAGDALLTETFVMLSDKNYCGWIEPEKTLRIIREIAYASGAGGLVEGQFHDINSFGKSLNQEQIEYINEKKTASLISAACGIGAILSGKNESVISEFKRFGLNLGLAFQAVDDILGIIGSEEAIGKTRGIDKINAKQTIAEQIGIEKTKEMIKKYNDTALLAIEKTGAEKTMLIELINYLTDRIN